MGYQPTAPRTSCRRTLRDDSRAVLNLEKFGSWNEIKDWIRAKGRVLVVYGGKSVPTHIFKEKGVPKFIAAEILAILSDDFMERTDGRQLNRCKLQERRGCKFLFVLRER